MNEFLKQGIAEYRAKVLALESLKTYLLANGVTLADLEVSEAVAQPQPRLVRTKYPTMAVGIPKGKMEWDLYAKLVLRELGGKAKSIQGIEYAHKANPRMDIKTVKDAIRSHWATMGRTGELIVDSSGPKSEGYEYQLKSDDPIYKHAA